MFPRRAFLLLLSGALVVALAHCSSDISGPLAPGIVAVSLTPPTATLRVGAIVQLTPTVTVDGSTAVRDVSYISSDPIVVDVSPTGRLRALNVGTADITAIVGDTSATVKVTVIAGPPVSVVKRVGDEQTAPAGSMVAIPPAVTVLDSAGNPVTGVGVSFKGTGVVAGVSATTNDIGVAVVTTWTLSTTAGPNTLTATVAGLEPVTFTATGTAATIGLSATSASATSAAGGSAVIVQSVNATNTGTGALSGLALGAISFTGTSGWLTATIAAGTAGAGITLTANPAGLAVGTYTATVPVSATNAQNGPQAILFTLVITPAATATALTTSTNPSAFGKPVTLTATVTASGIVPTGTVQFRDGGVALGAPVTLAAGSAALTTSSLTITGSPHLLTAEYSGDANAARSASLPLSQVVGVASTFITLSSSASTGTFGSPVTFTATVTGSGGTPTGAVTFNDGSTVLGSGILNSGVGVIVVPTLSVAGSPHAVTASYAGDATYAASVSASVAQNVIAATTTTALTSSALATTAGQSVTFTAAVTTQLGAAATGSVTFSDGGGAIGTVPLSAGVAAFSTTALSASVSPHAIVGVYSGDANNTGSTSAALSQLVSTAATSVALATSLNPSTFGSAVTFRATVTGSLGTPTGNVTFKDGATTIGTSALNASGVATFPTSLLAVADSPHSITAFYQGDGTFSSAISTSVAQLVSRASTSTTINSSASVSAFGQSVTFSATLTSAAGTPNGVVTFYDGAATIGSAAVDASGTATVTVSTLSMGAHSVTGVYAGDTSFSGSTSAPLSQAVGKATPSIALSANATSSTFGSSVTFTVRIAGGATVPGGSVTFKDGGTDLSGAIALTGGVATFTSAALRVAGSPHAVTAVYSGDANYLATASAATSLTVTPVETTVTLSRTVEDHPSLPGISVTFLAVIAFAPELAERPTGTMQFRSNGENIGAPVALSVHGAATLTIVLTAGASPHTITAVYSGDANYQPGTSNSIVQLP